MSTKTGTMAFPRPPWPKDVYVHCICSADEFYVKQGGCRELHISDKAGGRLPHVHVLQNSRSWKNTLLVISSVKFQPPLCHWYHMLTSFRNPEGIIRGRISFSWHCAAHNHAALQLTYDQQQQSQQIDR